MAVNNYFSPISFKVVIDRLPNTEFFTQRALIPSVLATPVPKSTPIGTVYETPDRLIYSEFDLGFIIDEDMKNYKEILDWIKGVTSPETTNQFRDLKKSDDGIKSDISMVINNSHKNGNKKYVFTDCIPIALSSISLDVRSTDIIYPEATATFRYNYFTLEDVN